MTKSKPEEIRQRHGDNTFREVQKGQPVLKDEHREVQKGQPDVKDGHGEVQKGQPDLKDRHREVEEGALVLQDRHSAPSWKDGKDPGKHKLHWLSEVTYIQVCKI